MERIIGIDLGTTNSVAAIMDDERSKVVVNMEGKRLTPSVVAMDSGGRWLMGQVARSQAAVNPNMTVSSIKRKVGTDEKVNLNGREYTPQEISAVILEKIRMDVECYLGEEVKKAVITVPAYFNDNQRQATKDAGTIAGLDVVRIINEPTAASLAYGLDREDLQTILVWDLGGGTFDVSILKLNKGIFQVKAVGGNTQLGGDDWDERISGHLISEFERDTGICLDNDPVALQRIREAAEDAKKELSCNVRAVVRVPFLVRDRYGSKNLETVLTKVHFEDMTRDLLQKMVEPTEQALKDAELTPDDIDRVVLVGGSTRMTAVRKLVTDLIGKEPYMKVNPDEVVAMGAAIQAGILMGDVKEKVLVDVIPLSLGIETQGSIFAPIIQRNTTIPASRSQIFTTAKDNQPEVDIHILQGERVISADNISLGTFTLKDIPVAKRGEPQIEVDFNIDVNGLLRVTARDLYTENEAVVEVNSKTRLSVGDIERMVTEAKKKAEDDRRKKEEVQANIQAENMIEAAVIFMEEKAEELTQGMSDLIEEGILKLKESLAGQDTEKIKKEVESMRKRLSSIDMEPAGKREMAVR